MADRPLLLNQLAARITDWRWMEDFDHWAMATMISPTIAVAVAKSFPQSPSEVTLAFYPGPEQVKAHVVVRDNPPDLVLLETEARDIPEFELQSDNPANTNRLRTYFVVPPGEPRTVDARILAPYLIAFEPVERMNPAAVGAPIAAGNQLVGIISGYAGEGAWHYIPASELKQWAAPPPEEPEALDENRFFARLNAGGRRALSYAAGIAKGGEVEMMDLLFGLHENYAGTTRRLFRARDILMESVAVVPAALTTLPPVNADVRRALVEAARIAGSPNERIRGRHLLYGALSVTPFEGLTAEDVQLDDDRSVLGHRADTVDGEDLLDIKREARVLAGVLGAESVVPPISLGLFGEWGSGKSFFMREMERQFGEIEGKPGYCANIVQIWFNAWHYIDTPNLWASLAAEIFERLDFELSVREGTISRDATENARAGVLSASARTRTELTKLSDERTKIESNLERVENGLEELNDERVIAASLGLRSVFSAAVDAASVDPNAKKEIKDIAANIDKAQKNLHLDDESLAELRETTSRGRALFLAAKKLPRTSWLLIALFVLLMIGAVPMLRYLNEWIAQLSALAGAAGVVAVTMLSPAGKAVRTLYRAWQLKNDLIEKERNQRAKPLIEKKQELSEALVRTKAEEVGKAAELQQHEEALANLEPRRQMSNFVRERKQSTTYTSRLGVIASAHDDFDELSRLLKRAAENRKADDKTAPVDRIVLYIDDLDRCPEDKVVDVLQAVHLLLAFPLFIVVVGVDSRWLLHSLQRHLKQFRAGQDDDPLSRALWESTPLNYLEKIFQIPFTIRRMRFGAFGELIENLTLPQNEVAKPRPMGKGAQPAAPTPETSTPASIGPGAGTSTPSSSSPQTPQQPATPTTTPTQPATAPPVDYLALQKWEREAMKAMYPLIPSPRAAKRFVNTYRLMRGMIDEYEREAFVGTDENTGDYRAALMMLAMLTGYPEETSDLLRELVTSSGQPLEWWSFVESLVTRRIDEASAAPSPDQVTIARWQGLQDRLTNIKTKLPLMLLTETFVKWAPAVARFSFHSGRMVTQVEGE